MIQIEDVTGEQQRAIDVLKKRTEGLLVSRMLEDQTLFYRYLKARDFDIKEAEALLKKYVSDFKFYEIEDYLQNCAPSKHMLTYFPVSFVGFDKHGSVVRYIDLGGFDVKGITSFFEFKTLIQYNAAYLQEDIERMTEQTKLGKPAYQSVYIFNMDKLNLFKVTYKKGLEMAFEGARLFQDSHPERIKHIIVINAQFYFHIGYSVCKHVLSEGLIKKIRIYGTTGWKEALLDMIDADVLPAFLGGNRKDPDGNPLCNSFITHGKIIPEELYLKKSRQSIKNETGVKQLTVTRFSSSEIEIFVSEPNMHIEWEFETKTRDIAFGLYYREDDKKNKKYVQLIPKQRIDTMIAAETGIYKCDKAGTYIIVFDNSYSWIYSKEIYYRIRLLNSCEENFTKY